MDTAALLEKLKKNWLLLAAAGVVVVLLIIFFSIKVHITNAGNTKEQDLNAQYNTNIGQLSNCITQIRETAGVAKGQTAAFDEIMLDAVKGRYDQGSTAQVGQGALFSAIHEAYPDLTQLGKTFDNVMTVVRGCRQDYQDDQAKLQDMIAKFEQWRTGHFWVRHLGGGFPNDNLIAQKGSEVLHGKDALDQMRVIVVVSDATNAYQTGELTPEDPFGTNTAPSPSSSSAP